MRPQDTFEGQALAGEQEWLDSLPPHELRAALSSQPRRFTTTLLRDGRPVKAFIEQTPEPPVSRLTAFQLLSGAVAIVRGHAGEAVREDWLERAEKALARERGAVR